MIRTYILGLALWSISGLADAQTRYYVDINAGGQNNGQSWSDAFFDLHDALALALSGDEIWVARGQYYPSATGDRSARFQLPSGVKLYGSFVGTELLLEERQIVQNPSILSGDIGVTGDSVDNSYTILLLIHPDEGTLVDGFTFRLGQADDPSLINSQVGTSGAAIFIDGANSIAYPNIQNCIFEHNTSRANGGAVYVEGGGTGSIAPVFKNCVFYQNHSLLSGGGLYRNGGSWVERSNDFEHCAFLENWANRSGGGLYINDSERSDTTNIVGCNFQGNLAISCSDALAWGYVRSSGSYFRVSKSRFTDHQYSGTLMMDVFGQDSPTSEFYAEIDSCVFANNSSPIGSRTMIGGLRFYSESHWKISNTTISDNMGAIFLCDETNRGEAHDFNNMEITGNSMGTLFTVSSGIVGKNLSIHDNNTYLFFTWLNTTPGVDYSHSFHLANSEIFNNEILGGFTDFRGTDSSSIVSCTFSNNLQTGFVLEKSSMHIFNSISFKNNYISPFSNGSLPFLFDALDTLYVFNSSIDTIPALSPIHFYGQGSLFSTDPLFEHYQTGNLRLLPCSPLLNKGSNLAASGIVTDIAGNPRITEGIVDIGAYESPAFALAEEPTVSPACGSDSNGSILVNPVFGCEPYNYDWFPQAGNGPELNGLPPGQYQLRLTDASGRQILDTITVGQAPAPMLSLVSTDVQCGDLAGGSLQALVAGGTEPFQYHWLPAGQDTSQQSQLPFGAYALTLTDANGCQDSATASIALLGMLQPMIGVGPISCTGAADGWLSLSPASGAPPFSWQWSGWPGTDSVAQPLGPGNYSATVTDAYGCTVSTIFPPVNDPAAITVTVGVSNQTDPDIPNGAAVVTTSSGGTPFPPPAAPYQYAWSTDEMGQFIAGLSAGEYTVTVTDQNGCTSSLTVVVELTVGTGDPKVTEASTLLIYPNPTADWAQVLLPNRQGSNDLRTVKLVLSDESGRVLRVSELPNFSGVSTSDVGKIDLYDLPCGAYFLTVCDIVGNTMFVGKVMKH